MELQIVFVLTLMLLYTVLSEKFTLMGITMPMAFLALGLMFGASESVLSLDSTGLLYSLAELTLSLMLFADATKLRLAALGTIGLHTVRMLAIGLPMAIIFGAFINWLVLPAWPIWELCLLAALLAPTDAALGRAIQSNPKIPKSFRYALSAESGLNDGLSLPFVIFFAGLAVSGTSQSAKFGDLLVLIAMQIGFGVLAGLVLGVLYGKLRDYAISRKLMQREIEPIANLLFVALVYFVAELAEENSFVTIFIAGIAFTNTTRHSTESIQNFLEEDGKLFAMFSFFFIGALFVPEALETISWSGVMIITLSILVVRPISIWISLMGTQTTTRERLFYGWFGPRGLATVLFGIFVAMDFEGLEQMPTIMAICVSAVLISATVHGLTAKYAAEIFKLDEPR